MCLDALAAGGGWQLNFWRRNGGDATLKYYGGTNDAEELAAIPADHRAWLAGLPFIHEEPLRIFVHAGLEPYTPLADQDAETFLWIREAFLRAPASAFPKHVVHGHTPVWAGKPDPVAPERLPYRTNLDTGAYMTGVLTAAVFDISRTRPQSLLTGVGAASQTPAERPEDALS